GAPIVNQAIDKGRLVPELHTLNYEMSYDHERNNLWPLTVRLHREIDRIEGGVVDLPSRRQTDGWNAAVMSTYHQDTSARSAEQLRNLEEAVFGSNPQEEEWPPVFPTKALLMFDESNGWINLNA